VQFAIVDARGDGTWQGVENDTRSSNGYLPVIMSGTTAEWLRVSGSRLHGGSVSSSLDAAADIRRRAAALFQPRRVVPRPRGRADCCARPASRARCSSWRTVDAAAAWRTGHHDDRTLEFARRSDAPDKIADLRVPPRRTWTTKSTTPR
jgi:hypothetical protein